MKKTIYIIAAIVLVALLFVTIMLLTDKDKPLEQPQSDTTETQKLPEIDYYENNAIDGVLNTSTAPSIKINMAEGKVMYADGTEKNWLELYKEQESIPDTEKLFTFVGGTTLVNAFESNEDIASIVIPEGITELESCFNNNFTPCSITLPSTLESVNHSFDNARDMQLITKDNSKMVVIDNVLYTDFGETLLIYPDWKEDSEYVVPKAVKKISREAIADNVYLTQIVFNEGLEIIERRGVNNCPNIVAIKLPDSLKTIDSSFNNMSLLESLNIPKNCTLVGVNFMHAPRLKLQIESNNYVYEDDVLYNHDKTSILRYMEANQNEEFIIPETVLTIGPSAFAYNTYLRTLTVNEGIEIIGTAFTECTNLKTVNLPETLKTIKTMAFTRLPNLTTINYSGTIDQWIALNKEVDWIISSIEYKINCADESISYKGVA